MTNYIAIIISFLTGAITITRDIIKSAIEYKKARRSDKKDRIRNAIWVSSSLFLLLLIASSISFIKQVNDDKADKLKSTQHKIELDETMNKLGKLLGKSENLLNSQNKASTKLSEQLDSTSIILKNSRENINKTDSALLEFARINNDLKNVKISFTVIYDYADKSYNSWFTSSFPDQAVELVKSQMRLSTRASFRGQFVGGNYLTGDEAVFMTPFNCIVAKIKDKDTTLLWLGIWGMNYPEPTRVKQTIYDKYFPWGESLMFSFQRRFTVANKSEEKYWDIIKSTDLLFTASKKEDDETTGIVYKEINFKTKTVREDINNFMIRDNSNNSIKSLIDLKNIYLTVYPSTGAKSNISNLVFSCGDDYSTKVLLDPYLSSHLFNPPMNKFIYHIMTK